MTHFPDWLQSILKILLGALVATVVTFILRAGAYEQKVDQNTADIKTLKELVTQQQTFNAVQIQINANLTDKIATNKAALEKHESLIRR